MKKLYVMLLLAGACSMAGFAQSKQTASVMQMADPAYTNSLFQFLPHQPIPHTLNISGFYQEGFEGTTFPPTGWQALSVLGTKTWARTTTVFHSGIACAFMDYQGTGGEDWLITPRFLVSTSTDSIVFWMKLRYSGFAPDSLILKASVTDTLTTSFTSTILTLYEGLNYPGNSTSWVRYGASLSSFIGQHVYIAFKHSDYDGDGVYVDDVSIGTKPANDVAAVSINMPGPIIIAPTFPQATFTNLGSATQTFNVTMQINPGGYTSTLPVTALAPSASTNINFASWLPPSAGNYTAKAFTQLAGDVNHTNDTVVSTITVTAGFPNNGWTSKTALPSGRWATAPAFSKACITGTDTGLIYLIGGADDGFNTVGTNTRYNIASGTWNTKTAIPALRMQFTPVQVQNKIYVIGGYSTSFTPVNTNSIYDIATDTWTTGAVLPTAVGDYAVGVYGDSLIYIVGGYTGSADANLVQIYHITSNTWTAGTVKPGTATSGCRMGISGNTIVFVGGYSQTLAASLNAAYKGVINPANPQTITWTALPAYPGGTVGRHAGGVSFENDNRVYFCGGDPDGGGISVLNTVFGYNLTLSAWEVGPAMLNGVSNISGLIGVIENGTRYLVTMGGYNGTIVGTYNEWLELGPATPLPYAQSDTAICKGSSFTLDAFYGTSYLWTPSAGLNDTTIASPLADPVVTTTYNVTIGKAYGCPVTDDVTVTVNDNPVISTSSTDVLCNGSSDGTGTVVVTGTSGYDYYWSTGGITATVNLPAGTFTILVTDTVTGCFALDSVVLNEPPALSVTVDNDTVSGCTGLLIANVSGGTPPYVCSWNDPGMQVNDSAFNLCTGSYTVQVTDSNGCVVSVSADVVLSTGIVSIQNAMTGVYPNPVCDVLNLTASLSGNSNSIRLADVTGRQVMLLDEVNRSGAYARTFNLGSLHAGIYLLQITEGDAVISVVKLIKQ